MFCQGLVSFRLIFLTKFVAVECVCVREREREREREIKRDWVGLGWVGERGWVMVEAEFPERLRRGYFE